MKRLFMLSAIFLSLQAHSVEPTKWCLKEECLGDPMNKYMKQNPFFMRGIRDDRRAETGSVPTCFGPTDNGQYYAVSFLGGKGKEAGPSKKFWPDPSRHVNGKAGDYFVVSEIDVFFNSEIKDEDAKTLAQSIVERTGTRAKILEFPKIMGSVSYGTTFEDKNGDIVELRVSRSSADLKFNQRSKSFSADAFYSQKGCEYKTPKL
jgi:hypothetical protein